MDISDVEVSESTVAVNATSKKAFDSLAQAFAAEDIADGDVIVVTAPCSITEQITVTKDITLLSQEAVTVTNAVDPATKLSAFLVSKDATFTLAGELDLLGYSDNGSGIAASFLDTEDGTSGNYASIRIEDNVQIREHVCTATSKGGAITLGKYAYLSMNGGKIAKNQTSGAGGAIYAGSYSSVVLYSGMITSNKANATGGAINLNNDATLQIKKPKDETASMMQITYNEAKGNGGAIAVPNTAKLVMEDGAITGNTSQTNGAIYVNGEMKLAGGSITSNSARAGGAVYLDTKADATITGTTITGNAAKTSTGGGIYHAGNSLMLSGSVTITDNVMESKDVENNIQLVNKSMLTISDAVTADSRIGITLATGNVGEFATGAKDRANVDNFFSDVGNYGIGMNQSGGAFIGYRVVFDANGDNAQFTGEHADVVVAKGGTIEKFPTVERKGYYQDNSEGMAWYVETQAGKPSYITTYDDVSKYNAVDGVITVKANWYQQVATLRRNGVEIGKYADLATAFKNSLDGDEIVVHSDYKVNAVIPVSTRVTLSSEPLMEGAEGNCTLTRANKNMIFNVTTGALNIKNLNLNGSDNPYSIIAVNGGTLTIGTGTDIYGMNFGTTAASNTTGYGAVYLVDGTVTMQDGKIRDNRMNGYGGGVYMYSGTFNMTGGEISGNSSDSGSGVYVYEGNFNMTGGTITKNTSNSAAHKGDGIYAYSSISLGGSAKVTGNDVSNIYLRTGAKINIKEKLTEENAIGITMESPEEGYFTNKLSAYGSNSNFVSDSAGYGVGMTNGEAYLGYKVLFRTAGGYFKEDEELSQDQRQSQKQVIAMIGSSMELPVVYRESMGFTGWTYELDGVTTAFTDETIVTGATEVVANWDTANLLLNGHYYYDMAEAVKEAGNGDTITLLEDITQDSTVVLDKSLTIAGAVHKITLNNPCKLFVVQEGKEGEVTITPEIVMNDVILDANGQEASLMEVTAGTVTIDGNSTITGTASAAQTEGTDTSNKTEIAAGTNGYGAIYVNGGTVNFKGGLITKNRFNARGAAVHVSKGQFLLNGGVISDNTSVAEGGGIYVAEDAEASLTSGKIYKNVSETGNGGGIYAEGCVKLGTPASERESLYIAENTSNNLYLVKDNHLVFSGKLPEADEIHVTLQAPSQGAFTTSMKDNAEINKQIVNDMAEYTMATDEDGEAYVGYQFICHVNAKGAYFIEEAELAEDKRSEAITKVLVPDSVVLFPAAKNEDLAVAGWYLDDGTEITDDAIVTGDREVYAKWTGATCQMGEEYFVTLEKAVTKATKLEDKADITLLSNCMLTKTIPISTEIAIDGKGYTITRGSSMAMFRVYKDGRATFQDVIVNGNNYNYNLLYVDGGTAVIADGAKFRGCANGVQADNMLETSGPGSIFLQDGKLLMTGGTITGNAAARGAGVYVNGGDFVMSGGSITGNKISDAVSIYGAGVYLGSHKMKVSGNASITGNELTSGAEQNVYYNVGEGGIILDDVLAEGFQIGVTPSMYATGITSDTMVDVTDISTQTILDTYQQNMIYSDDGGMESVKDEDNWRIRLRYGHTVVFDKLDGVIEGESVYDILHDKCITTLPTASLAGRYFDGWFTDDGTLFTNETKVTKSMTLTARYTVGKCAEPTISPAGNTYYAEKKEITLATATKGASIYFTLDGTTPTTKSNLYTGPFELTEDHIIKAIAIKNDWSDSSVITQEYTICNVQSVNMKQAPVKVFRGYESTFVAEVKTGNESTSNAITWELDGVYTEGTAIDENGVLKVAKKEAADEITVRAVSQNPDKYATVKVPVLSQYTVIYEKNSPLGQNATGTMEDTNSPYLKDSEVKVQANAYACAGYTFKRWNTAADGSGTDYYAGDTFKVQEDTALYAIWEVNVIISKVSVSPKSATVTQGEVYPFTATVSGKGNLTGEVTWSMTGQKSENTTISESGVLSVDKEEEAESVVITATSVEDGNYWGSVTVTIQDLTRYTIGYQGTGGQGDMSDKAGIYIAGTELKVEECAFTKKGYQFISWNTAVNGKGASLLPGDTYKINENTVLYAQWIRSGDYEDDDGKTEDVEPDKVYVKTDKDYALETIALIEAIGTVSTQSKDAIAAARASYDALTQAQKDIIGYEEYNKLLLSEMKYSSLIGNNTTANYSPITGDSAQAGTTAQGSSTAANTAKPLAKGKKFTSGNYQYKVTKSSATNGEVTLMKPKKKTFKKVTIADTVTYKGITYKVTAIANKAFYNNKRLTKVTIGKNVTQIGKKAFYKAKKCKTITIKSASVKKIGQKAFTGISKKACISMPDEKFEKYERMLENAKLDNWVSMKTY